MDGREVKLRVEGAIAPTFQTVWLHRQIAGMYDFAAEHNQLVWKPYLYEWRAGGDDWSHYQLAEVQPKDR